MDVLGFTADMKTSIWKILAGILHVGNVNFSQDQGAKLGQTSTVVSNGAVADTAAQLWQCDATSLKRALTFRSISTGVGKRGSVISVPLDVQQALFTRDALAKATYERVFTWLVEHINKSLACKSPGNKLTIGILGILRCEDYTRDLLLRSLDCRDCIGDSIATL
jgi:myosin heavy subunit